MRSVTGYHYHHEQTIAEQLRDIGEQLLDMRVAPSFTSLAKVTLAEMLRSPDRARKTYELFRERQSGLAVWLGEAAADGRLDIKDPVWAADQFFGLIKSFAFWPQILGGQPVPDAKMRKKIVDSSVQNFLRAYGLGPVDQAGGKKKKRKKKKKTQ